MCDFWPPLCHQYCMFRRPSARTEDKSPCELFCKSGFRELKPWQLHFTLFILGNFVRPSTSTHNQELEVSSVLSVSVAWLECFILVCAVWYIFQTMTFVLRMSRQTYIRQDNCKSVQIWRLRMCSSFLVFTFKFIHNMLPVIS